MKTYEQIMENRGFDPLTPALPAQCSTNVVCFTPTTDVSNLIPLSTNNDSILLVIKCLGRFSALFEATFCIVLYLTRKTIHFSLIYS